MEGGLEVISDSEVLAEVKDSWGGVSIMRERLTVGLFAAVGWMGGVYPHFVADAAHNLPFVHACSVLNDVLRQLAKENHFNCQSQYLGLLIKAGKTSLTWHNYALIEEIVARRNGIAHRGEVVPRGDCWRYIDEIEKQLQNWGVLDAS